MECTPLVAAWGRSKQAPQASALGWASVLRPAQARKEHSTCGPLGHKPASKGVHSPCGTMGQKQARERNVSVAPWGKQARECLLPVALWGRSKQGSARSLWPRGAEARKQGSALSLWPLGAEARGQWSALALWFPKGRFQKTLPLIKTPRPGGFLLGDGVEGFFLN